MPKLAYISTIALTTASSLASSPHKESRMIDFKLANPSPCTLLSVNSPVATSPTVPKALQSALPNKSQSFTRSLTNIETASSHKRSFKACKSAANIFLISPIHLSGLTNFGIVMSSMFLQKGRFKSLIKSKTVGLNNGGLGQSIAIIAVDINLAPGKRFK